MGTHYSDGFTGDGDFQSAAETLAAGHGVGLARSVFKSEDWGYSNIQDDVMQVDDCAFEKSSQTAATVDLYTQTACHMAPFLLHFLCLLAFMSCSRSGNS